LDSDRNLLARVNSIDDFFASVLVRDALDDWNLARDFGDFLARLGPDKEVVGHVLMARAYRHLGNAERALVELNECQARIANQELTRYELELYMPVLEKEKKLLSAGD
jgi:hypothetical protein